MPFTLAIAGGKGRGRRLRLAGEAGIGRGGENEVVVNDPAVSRRHAVIEERDGAWTLRDAGSANGTRLNGRPVLARVRLADGDRIAVGPVVFAFRGPSEASGLALRWRALRPPVRAVCVAGAVLLFGVAVECAAHLSPRSVPPAIAGTAQSPPVSAASPAPLDLTRAHAALERGRRKLLERRVAPRNLYDAWRSFLEAREALAAVGPRQPEEAGIADAIARCERDLRRECRRLSFSADRFERYGEAGKVQQAWREMLLHFPGEDPGGCWRKARENVVSAQPDVVPE